MDHFEKSPKGAPAWKAKEKRDGLPRQEAEEGTQGSQHSPSAIGGGHQQGNSEDSQKEHSEHL